ncbi:hypothetical protein [Streptomyces subrutilus]|uniref:hypothetical protein n=1 Tax=Streptomyces subrutilus TaxID=36818 RepID=UPI0033FEC6DA
MTSARENTPLQNFLGSLFFLAVGAAILFVGFKINSSPADCGGETMSAGDTCVSYSGSHQTGSNDLDEQKSENSSSANGAFVVGGIVILASAWLSVAALRDMGGSSR